MVLVTECGFELPTDQCGCGIGLGFVDCSTDPPQCPTATHCVDFNTGYCVYNDAGVAALPDGSSACLSPTMKRVCWPN